MPIREARSRPGTTIGGIPIEEIKKIKERAQQFEVQPQKPTGRYMRPSTAPQEFQHPREDAAETRRPAAPRANASWGSVSDWYKEHLEGDDTFHAKVLLPNLLRLIDPKRGETIVDVACGEGFFARAMAEKGALITGVDIAASLIESAKRNDMPGITYHVGSAVELSTIVSGSFDQAYSILALQNMEHADHAIAEVANILKEHGVFHLVLNHPSFRIPKSSYWGYDDSKRVQFRRVDRYLSESKEEIVMHPGAKVSEKTISYHHPLQWYVKHLAKSGLLIDRMEEWISHKTSDSGPRANAENRARKEIPLFLYLRAKKIG